MCVCVIRAVVCVCYLSSGLCVLSEQWFVSVGGWVSGREFNIVNVYISYKSLSSLSSASFLYFEVFVRVLCSTFCLLLVY